MIISFFYFRLRSCDIITPAEYSSLVAGGYSHCQNIMINGSSHEDVMSLPKQFQSAQFQVIAFGTGDYECKNENTIYMEIEERTIKGYFTTDNSFLLGLPTDYETYELHYNEEGSALTDGEFDALLTWTNVKKLSVYDVDTIDFALKFTKNIDQMSAMTSLEEISMVMYRDTIESINFKDFLTKLPALKKAHFLFSSHLHYFDVRETFFKNLEVVKTWECVDSDVTVPKRKRDFFYFAVYKALECAYIGEQ